MTSAGELPLLERRRIEAGVLVPLIRAFQAEFGEERVNEIVRRTIRGVARAQGAAERERQSVDSMAELAERTRRGPFGEGSLELEVMQEDDAHFGFNVTRCRFQEMYEEMGARDLGFLLSCNRDFAYFEALAPGVRLERSQTRMQGAAFCDFRYTASGSP